MLDYNKLNIYVYMVPSGTFIKKKKKMVPSATYDKIYMYKWVIDLREGSGGKVQRERDGEAVGVM